MNFFSAIFARALTSRNYRLYFTGQLISLAGTWMQQIAMIWLAWRLSNSAQVLGMVGFASQIPILLLGPFTGVLTDRFDRRRILIITQSVAMLQALMLTALTWLQWISPSALIGMAFVLGCVNALDVPARQAFSVQLVDNRADLPNAIALNSLLMNTARFVGPALAGLAVASIGEAWCFAINAASYLAVILALLAIDSKSRSTIHESALAAFREGFRYVLDHPDIRSRLLVVAAVSFLVTPYAVLMPLFASTIFHGDARTYGFLIGCAGAGSLLAGLYLASRKGTEGLSRRAIGAVIVTGAALSLFAINHLLPLAFVIVMALGFSVILVIAGSNTLIQVWVEDAYRGRVMAIFSMAFLGVAPLGSFAVGHLAHYVGVQPTLLGCGIATVLVGLMARHRL
ncbi:MAG TPA: MFS transporter [Rhodocyclaceae bacterium]|nr:MFS transporter [Rhodocyclaceae bacterium]